MALEDLLRELTPQVLGAVVRWSGDFAAAEDAVQEALLAAATTWPRDGRPDKPKAWLIQTASRRLIDEIRQEQARRHREEKAALRDLPPEVVEERDDTLQLLFLSCHPALTPASAIALTLRAVGGLTTAEIAAAYLVPEATMAQRISRAKQKLKGASFELDTSEERLRNVLHVLYLIFNEGYMSSSGPDLHRSDLSGEAIRLTRAVHTLLPGSGQVTGLLALMLLTDARRSARTGSHGELIHWPSRTARCGTRSSSLKACPARSQLSVRRHSVSTSSRPRSRHCTMRRTAPRTPTGRRSSRSTACSRTCPATRW